MNHPIVSARMRLWAATLALGVLLVIPTLAISDTGQRVVVLRERASLSFLEGAFTFELLKIRGYSIDVRFDGKRKKLKLGDTLSAQSGECSVTFHEISPEAPIARFLTDCS